MKNTFSGLQVQILVQVYIKMVHFSHMHNLVQKIHKLGLGFICFGYFLHFLVQNTVFGVHLQILVKFYMFWYTEKIGALYKISTYGIQHM